MFAPYEIRFVNDLQGDPAVLVIVKRTDEHLLFDLGDISSLSHKEVLKVRHIFISHTHMDHFFGFDKALRFNIPHRKDLFFYGPNGLSLNVQSKLKSYTWNLIDPDQLPFYIRDLQDSSSSDLYFCGKKTDFDLKLLGREELDSLCVLKDGSLVQGIPLDHNGINSIAYQVIHPVQYRIDTDALAQHGLNSGPWISELLAFIEKDQLDEKVYVGDLDYKVDDLKKRVVNPLGPYVMSYITDVGFSEENLNTVQNSFQKTDSLVIECSFKHNDLDRSVQKAHLTTRQSALIASLLSCEDFKPFHVSNIYEDPDEVIQEAQRFFEEFSRLAPEKLQVELLKELDAVAQCKSVLGGD